MSEDNSYSDPGSSAPSGSDSFGATQADYSSATPAAPDLQPSFDSSISVPNDGYDPQTQPDLGSGMPPAPDLPPSFDSSIPDSNDANDPQIQPDISVGSPAPGDYQPQPDFGVYVPPPSQPFDNQSYPDISEIGGWWDKQAAPYKPGSGYLWFHVFCCQCPGIVVALLLMMFCRTQTGKENGARLLKYSLVGCLVAIALRVLMTLASSAAR